MTATTTKTETTVVKLLPSVKRTLLVELQAAQKDKMARDAADARYNARKAKIRAIREATGEQSLEIDGYVMTNVTGETSSFDVKKMLAHGLSMETIESFKVKTPKRPYEKITFPSDRVARRLMGEGGHHASGNRENGDERG